MNSKTESQILMGVLLLICKNTELVENKVNHLHEEAIALLVGNNV